jgi:CRP-like cAMP-binding protein/ActR/RegA family two-component response regulator
MNTILVIEDNEEMAENIVGILELANYNVLSAPNGKMGVVLAQQHLPDLVLCDVMMPELDGYGVLHILNKNPETAGIPFIFLTAKADKSDFREGMNLGADDYITKPFDGFDLLKVIEIRLKKTSFLKATFGNDLQDLNSFFSQAKEMREFQRLSENRPMRTFKKKDLIFMEGEMPNDLYFIVRGSVKTYKLNYEGKELVTSIHRDGSFFGYTPLLEDKNYGESAEALDDTQVVVIPKNDFLILLYSSKDVARKFIKMLSNNLEDAEKRLLDVAYQSVRQRVAGALLHFHEKYAIPNGQETISFARKDISGMIGTAPESLNRTLADFRDEGLIEILEDGLKILDQKKLERLSR